MNFKTIQNIHLFKGLYCKCPLLCSINSSLKLKPNQRFNYQYYQILHLKQNEFKIKCKTTEETADDERVLIGEDSALFKLKDQKLLSWSIFTILLSSVLALMYLLWISPNYGYADDFLNQIKNLTKNNSEITITLLLFIFALFHSGLAAIRPAGEKIIGPRPYRVIYALISLPLAVLPVVYFINHRYDGIQLWTIQNIPGIKLLVWTLSFISFFFLYPSTFNLLEVASVDEPKLHLWETGIIRISRHPQAIGQGLWCLGHTLWIGNSFMIITSLALLIHHAFGCWHGDKRLYNKYGKEFDEIKERTSIIPFKAILDGRQKLPKEYYKEFLRGPYFVIAIFTIGVFMAHPIIFKGCYELGW